MNSNALSLTNMPINLVQCAWCLAIADGHGDYTIPSDSLVDGSHGICAACAEAWLKEARAGAARTRQLQRAA